MRTALVTGAYRGLGLEVARQLSARGFRVIISARQREAGLAAAAKVTNAPFLEMDITNAASIGLAVKQVSQLDVLINNAAILLPEDENMLQIAPETVARTLMTNAVGALQVSQAFIPLLRKSPAGRIINVSSGGGQLGETGTWAPAYCISKTALNGVTCQLAAALKDQGIAVNSVCPGWCRTEMGGAGAPRSAEEGAAGIVWLAAEAPQDKTALFWRDGKVIPW